VTEEDVKIHKRPRLPFWARSLPTPEDAAEVALSTADEADEVALATAEDTSLAMLLGAPTALEIALPTALETALETCLGYQRTEGGHIAGIDSDNYFLEEKGRNKAFHSLSIF